MKRTLYRVGEVKIGEHSEDVVSKWTFIDARKPAGHPVGRLECIYATPDVNGMFRWVTESILTAGKPLTVHEITVNEDEVFLYDVRIYDWLSDDYGQTTEEMNRLSEAYWNSGITVTQWRERHTTGWSAEVLVPPSAIVTAKQLSYRQAMKALKSIGLSSGDKRALGIHRDRFVS